MTRAQLEHILRASIGITGADCFVIIGSQAILGQFDNPPDELLVSMEADLFSLRDPEDSNLIDGSIGEGSPFHRTFGYYAHGVGPETAFLPRGWQDRLVPIRSTNTCGATGLCIEVHDLAVSKLVAGRDKDREFISVLARHSLVQAQTIRDRLNDTSLTDLARQQCLDRLQRLTSSGLS